MYWHAVNTGASFDEMEDLYNDICILDVMSGLEIDSAKKEQPVNNVVELKLLRKKYETQLTTADNKKVLPNFFSHISRRKGYYDPKKKAYNKHKTSMDYLQTIVNGFRVKNPYKQVKYSLI